MNCGNIQMVFAFNIALDVMLLEAWAVSDGRQFKLDP